MFSRRPVVFTAFVFFLVGLVALTCANADEHLKKYEEHFEECEELCEIHGKEECEHEVEKCQFFVRDFLYNDCMIEEKKCVDEGETDCHKHFLECIEHYARD
ncbi:unnamed protein product [Rodentolepis nana]|uniref:UCR_hinge domain-containing protein n=2 Tax=Rodentolepis nana TaxID=102285 RepID=A0A0R3TYB2_RODNA|nr:unnamed protein product [Rodentolepis nana]